MWKLLKRWWRRRSVKVYRVHVQIDYVNADGDRLESLLGVRSNDPILQEFVEEWQGALQHDPDAKLVFGGRCECSRPQPQRHPIKLDAVFRQ